jgi:hypothetical protein
MICAQMPYGGSIISHNILTNDGLSSKHMYKIAERITRRYPIGLRMFQSICTDKFEIWNLYAKHIIFICSLPTLTSTWHSDHHNGPGGYMSGELKLENIKYRKAPT